MSSALGLVDGHPVMSGVQSAPNSASPADAADHTVQHTCLNCQAPLLGEFCHNCGQHAHVHRTLGAFWHDFLHGVLHLEGKVWRTLPKLLFRPGELTRRYIAGERARFVSPLAMFLFSVFLMFAVMNFGGPLAQIGEGITEGFSDPEVASELNESVAAIDRELADLRQQRRDAAARGDPVAALDGRIADLSTQREIVSGIGDVATGNRPAQPTDGGAAVTVNAVPPIAGKEGVARKVTVGYSDVVGWQPGSGLDEAYRAAKKNPGLLLYKMQANGYKFSWLLILISVPMIMLLFLWRWRPMYDHTVFITYSITAVSLVLTAGTLLIAAGVYQGPVGAAIALFIPWHMYRQLRGGYELRRFSALWRTICLVIFATCALILFAIVLLMIGVLG